MSDQPMLFETEPPDERLANLKCPDCGYRPIDDVLPEGQLPLTMHDVDRMVPPETYERALDYFEVAGAEDGHLFCPVERGGCGCEFNPETGEVLELGDDFDGM